MRRFFATIKPYLAMAGCFLLTVIVLKGVELLLAGFRPSEMSFSPWQLFVNALVYNSIVVSWIILGGGLLYWLLSLLSRKAANITVSALFSLLFVSEVGLMLYARHNGYLLGSELFARPLSETLMAIRGAMGVALPIVLTLALLTGLISLMLWRASRPTKAVITLYVVVPIMLLLSLIFKTSHLFTFGPNNCYVHNKVYYLIVDEIDYLKYGWNQREKADIVYTFPENEVNALLSAHPEWGSPLSYEYPLERLFVADSFLNTCFKATSPDTKPNIVIILVESMGHEFMSRGAMPFVDSLAATGLYWPNCLSATSRSYGAIPAITGSVGGPKSFQFGTMPDHNSLVSLLKHEGYNTRAYYAGDFTFDCIYEYLSAQHIDYLSPFYDDFRATPEGKHGYWWGANDDYLFRKTMEDMEHNVPNNCSSKQKESQQPYLSLITTLTMHDKLELSDHALQASYEQRAKQFSHLAYSSRVAEHYPSTLFTDDCIRQFIHWYSHRPDFENTIFVLTGDHASGIRGGDKLSLHHVPLVIWSPLVKKPARFTHIVTHNDIAPALYSLLTSHYGLPAQQTAHWLGDGLGPTPKTLLIVNYSHDITDIIYHNHYYQSKTSLSPEALFSFDTNMKLQEMNDSESLEQLRTQLDLMTKLYFYTYHTNRLTAHPIFRHHFKLQQRYCTPHDIVCQYPEQPPSIGGHNEYEIHSTIFNSTEGHSTVRVNVEADVTINKNIYMLFYPEIRFCFSGDQKLKENELLSKFFTTNSIDKPGTYHISVTKDFPLSKILPNSIQVELLTPYLDDRYTPGVTMTLSNIVVSTFYGK